MQKILNKIIIIIFFLITACESSWDEIKKGLGGGKRTSTDEFLVKKKAPLTMPPKWEDLPRPGESQRAADKVEEATDIEELIQLGKNETTLEKFEQRSGDLEDSILKKIKKK